MNIVSVSPSVPVSTNEAPADRVASISIVVPVYRSAKILPELVARLDRVLKPTGRPFELILVNDGSPDDSWRVITRLRAQHGWIHGISLLRNFGQHNALLCGIRAARHDVIVTMDDDLQHPPEEIESLLSRLGEDCDAVYGVPAAEQHGILRDLASQITKFALQSSMGVDTARNVSAFRAFRTQLREGFERYQSPHVSIDVLLTWSTSRFAAVKVRHEPRAEGLSNYTLGKLIKHAFNMITGFSTLPLQVASLIGFGFMLLGFGVLCYVVGIYFWRGTSVPGFPFLASIISIFSGVQLFSLGVIGEYVARIHFRTMDRPSYAIREETRG